MFVFQMADIMPALPEISSRRWPSSWCLSRPMAARRRKCPPCHAAGHGRDRHRAAAGHQQRSGDHLRVRRHVLGRSFAGFEGAGASRHFAALAMSIRTSGDDDINKPEYSLLILLALVGMMLMISADNLMALYMGVELQSLPLYVVAAMRTSSLRSSEAGLKYFLRRAVVGPAALWRLACLWHRRTTDFDGMRLRFPAGPAAGLHHRHGVHDLRPCLQDRRAVPYVDAGCV